MKETVQKMPQRTVQKSFEQSLRSASPYAPLLRPRSDYHKGCTGKAHNNGSGGGGGGLAGQAAKNNKIVRRTSSSFSESSSSEVSTATHSDQSKNPKGGSNGQQPTRSTLQRAGSLRSTRAEGKSGPLPMPRVDSKPPWHHVYTTKLDALRSESDVRPSELAVSSTGPAMTTGRLRSRRKIIAVYWQHLYEKALAQKLYGGTYRRFVFDRKRDGGGAGAGDSDQVIWAGKSLRRD